MGWRRRKAVAQKAPYLMQEFEPRRRRLTPVVASFVDASYL
jgi:hypothetical protein